MRVALTQNEAHHLTQRLEAGEDTAALAAEFGIDEGMVETFRKEVIAGLGKTEAPKE